MNHINGLQKLHKSIPETDKFNDQDDCYYYSTVLTLPAIYQIRSFTEVTWWDKLGFEQKVTS